MELLIVKCSPQPNVKALIILPFQNGSTGLFNTFTGWFSMAILFRHRTKYIITWCVCLLSKSLCLAKMYYVFNLNQNYNYDTWAGEVQKLALNGGLSK